MSTPILGTGARPSVPELLAPAGDWEALRAALANGADAVYFGLDDFNARRRAPNFALADVTEVLDYLHGRHAKGYVAFNTLVFSGELARAADYAAAIAQAGADAVIVQDLGLLRLLRRLVPSLPVHASTQMTQTEPGGIDFLGTLGVSRVILARELSLAEIAAVAGATRVPLEVFVHGALCISYSGQCLASEALWGRSANRGLCGQACRLPYRFEVDGRALDLAGREHVLSPLDLATPDRIAALVGLGIAGFKIEGRLKSAAYVAAATRVYRAALDAALRGRPFELTRAQRLELELGFSRGLSGGYLGGVDHQKLVEGTSPKGRGTCIGRVVAKTGRGVIVEVAEELLAFDAGAQVSPLKAGDGVVFEPVEPGRPEQGGRIHEVSPLGGRRIALRLSGDFRVDAVALGCEVRKTHDAEVRRRLEATYRREKHLRRTPLSIRVVACPGQPLQLSARDDEGHEVEVGTDAALEEARRHPLTTALLREQLGRLGDTPFELGDVELAGPAGSTESAPVMAPKSVLNGLRRTAVRLLMQKRAAARRHRVGEPAALDRLRREILSPQSRAEPIHLTLLVRTLEQLHAALGWSPSPGGVPLSMLCCDLPDLNECGLALAHARAAGRTAALATPRVQMPGEEHLLDSLLDLRPDAILARSLGSLVYLRQRWPDLLLMGDYSLNAVNEIAAQTLLAAGASRVTVGLDANAAQITELVSRISAERLEVVLHQHVPLFHTRHCLYAARLTVAGCCTSCPRPCRQHTLRLCDRNGVRHLVWVDAAGRNTVFGACAQSGIACYRLLRDAGIGRFRLELVDETAAQGRQLLDTYSRLLGGALDSVAAGRNVRELSAAGTTSGTFVFE